MSEFDAFESSAAPEEDPAAAFLAREQDQMAEIEGEGFEQTENTETSDAIKTAGESVTESAVQSEALAEASSTNENMLADSSVPTEAGTNEVTDMFGVAPDAVPAESMSSNDLLDGFENVQASDTYDTFGQASEPQDQYAAISSVDKQLQEPEKIRLWREEQKERLATKDHEAEVKQEEWREEAKHELEEWYRHREEQLEKSKKTNREAEAAFCQERDESVPGHEWERVTGLCEFNPKAARNSKDVSRMRSILLQLKQTPLVR